MRKKYIKRIIKKGAEAYTKSTFIVVLFLILVLLLYLIFKILGLETQILSAAMTFTLLIITFLYTQATVGIINETKKDRQIRFIEKGLEKLYYPLKLRLIKFELDDDKPLDDFAFELVDSFSKYIYLASDEFASIWDGFIEQWDMDLYPNIEKQVEKDIKKYERELNNLIRVL